MPNPCTQGVSSAYRPVAPSRRRQPSFSVALPSVTVEDRHQRANRPRGPDGRIGRGGGRGGEEGVERMGGELFVFRRQGTRNLKWFRQRLCCDMWVSVGVLVGVGWCRFVSVGVDWF
mgnify:CR=1 FL=1